MIKTSTSHDSVNNTASQMSELAKNQDELFYNSIRSQLDELIKEPSEESIQKILDYSKKK